MEHHQLVVSPSGDTAGYKVLTPWVDLKHPKSGGSIFGLASHCHEIFIHRSVEESADGPSALLNVRSTVQGYDESAIRVEGKSHATHVPNIHDPPC